jgi:hypothetical protein
MTSAEYLGYAELGLSAGSLRAFIRNIGANNRKYAPNRTIGSGAEDILQYQRLKDSYRSLDPDHVPAGQLNVDASPPVDMESIYIPRDPDGNVIPLVTDDRNIVVYPLSEAEGRAHTVLGSRVSSRTEEIYRQSATFVEDNDIPWGRVDWTDHGLPLDHPSVHLHPLKPILNKSGNIVDWQQAPIIPFNGH